MSGIIRALESFFNFATSGSPEGAIAGVAAIVIGAGTITVVINIAKHTLSRAFSWCGDRWLAHQDAVEEAARSAVFDAQVAASSAAEERARAAAAAAAVVILSEEGSNAEAAVPAPQTPPAASPPPLPPRPAPNCPPPLTARSCTTVHRFLLLHQLPQGALPHQSLPDIDTIEGQPPPQTKPKDRISVQRGDGRSQLHNAAQVSPKVVAV